ncbi:NEDD4-binding protein 2 isoform X2 [Hemicordylus capensis]|uniref:NEDD4-binding protein 2 isoform X2 n=1 Tax=Hemicordylus capensis TaxID=884348 RepID=UPI0023047C52|nr:NEDD4-binding protein 2 isoform X2 [Hemicordylus capensis]
MPKKKKNLGVSPSQKIINSEATATTAVDLGPYPVDLAMSQPQCGVNKEELISSLSEMFSDLDPTVINMVLSEYDFRVEDSMDYLLELSMAAKGATSLLEVTGFDSISASLVGENRSSSVADQLEGKSSAEIKIVKSNEESAMSSDELMSLLQNPFGKHNLNRELKGSKNDQILGNLSLTLDSSSSGCFQELSDCAKSSLGYNAVVSSQQIKTDIKRLETFSPALNPDCYKTFELAFGKSGIQTKDKPLDDVNIFAQIPENCSLPEVILDSGTLPEVITPANIEMSYTNPAQIQNVVMDLTTMDSVPVQLCQGLLESETSAFDNTSSSSLDTEKRENEVLVCNDPKIISVPDLCPGSSFTLAPLENVDQSPQAWNSQFSLLQKHSQEAVWNLMAPAFYPQNTSHSFVTPVAVSPGKWRPASNYRDFGKICSPQATSQYWGSNSSLLKTWGNKDASQKQNLSQIQQHPVCHMMRRKTPLTGHVLVLLRGVPGSGKSYLARALLEDNPSGVILSTDDYFYQKNGQYEFDAYCLGEAHEWNWKRAKEAFEKRITPIIIDNTNIQAWEMKPYVALSQQHKYKVIFREPDTWWKFKPKELERRNVHGVSKEKIKRMLERYERCLTVSSILNSSVPDELKSATCDEVLHQEKEPGKEERPPHGSNGEPFVCVSTESLKHTELSMDVMHLLDRVALENQNLQDEKRASGYKLLEYSPEGNIPLGDLDICISHTQETMNPVLETKVIKTDLVKSEESSDTHFYINENIQECSDKNLEVQVEANPCNEVLREAELTERENVNEGDFEKSIRPEILNFVGDWPVEKTIGQRVKRARRLEKLTVKSDEDDRGIGMPPLDSLKVLDGNETLDLINIYEELPLAENKQEENGQSSTHTSIVDTAEDTSELLILGDWPVQNSLEQRQHKRRTPKRSISESEEISSSQCDINKDAVNIVAVLPETSVGTEELHVLSKKESFQASEISVSETISEKRPIQNKRTRKHNKLALTFTNSLPLSKPEEESSVLNFLEEKPNECSSAEPSKYSQTESQDFALLWRLERKIIVSEDTKVLHGRLDGFIPKSVDTASDYLEKVPYKVTYDKSTYVEESELVSIDESGDLNILCKLFGSLSFDALKDLYERCNRDIDWTTGILLDSAEKMCKDDDVECLQDTEIQPPGLILDSKEDTNCRKRLAATEETTQVSVTSQNLDIINSSVDSGNGKISDCSKLNAEIPNLLMNVLSAPSVENENFNNRAPRVHVEESENDKPLLDMIKIYTKEINPVKLPENEQQNMNSHVEIDFGILVTEPIDFNGGTTTLKPVFDVDMDNRSSDKHQECSEVENAAVQKQLADAVLLEDFASKEGKFEAYKETNCKPVFSSAAENEDNKMLNQNEDRIRLLNPKPASKSVDINCLELVLPPELAIQLSEIFGPVGVDSGSLTSEDYVVHIDLNLAKEIHGKWKASIMKRQKREEALQMLFEDDDLDSVLSQHTNCQVQKTAKLPENSAASEVFPFMDHWNIPTRKVSLREIMSEEIALQEKQDLKRFPFVARKDCAAKLKEKQLLKIFPTIHPNFLMDIFKDYNYSLEQTVQFLNSVLEADPVKTVIAKETTQGATLSSYSASKTRGEKKTKRSKEPEDIFSEKMFQDFEYPGYDDFRAEAFLHHKHRQECLIKAGEAYRMGMKPVAAFYVQQGRLHEEKMKEANCDAAVKIFEKVNASLLPENLLDLHGLHVDEALDHLCRILQKKTEEYSQAGGKPYLYVITGRGNHSQGGVARIKPAVMKYLISHKFRFTEIKPGFLKVMLK